MVDKSNYFTSTIDKFPAAAATCNQVASLFNLEQNFNCGFDNKSQVKDDTSEVESARYKIDSIVSSGDFCCRCSKFCSVSSVNESDKVSDGLFFVFEHIQVEE